MDQSDSFYNQGLDNPPSSTIDSVEKYFAKDINYRKPYEQQLRITTTMTAPTPPFSPPSIASSQKSHYHDQPKSKSHSRRNNHYKRHSTPLPSTKLDENEQEHKVITSEIALFMRCKTRYMHPDFKPIPPSPGGWVTPDRVVEWERTTEIFEEFSPYLIYNKHNKASEKDSKSEWRKAATWIGASNINGIDNPSSVSGLTPAVEVQRSYKQQSQSMIPKKQSEQALSLLAQRYLYQQAEQSTKRHYHARSWSPQSTCNTSNQFQNVQYLQEAETQSNWYYDLLQQQHQQQSINKSNRSTLSAAEEFNNDHVVNSILRVVDDELQLQPPPPTTMKAKEYCWNQLLQSNTENAFWNNLAIFIKTTQICSTNQLCTPFFFANFARTLMMHHASIHLVGIEMESWDFQGQQRKYYTVKPIYLPAMINQDPMTAVAHLIGFPSTLEENMMRLRESGISSETRMVLKSHFLL